MSHSVLLADLRRYREKHVDDRRTARRVFQERVRDGEIPRLRRVKPTASTITAIELYRLEQYRAFFAFIKSTGCDVGSALRAQSGDVNLFAGRTTIRGTKTDHRRVFGATIEPWALPYLRAQIAARRKADDGALLFPGLNRNAPSSHHARLCLTLGILDYTLKDARHSVGVRMRLAGKSFEDIAAQLGTSVYQAVTVYTKYRPEDAAKEASR